MSSANGDEPSRSPQAAPKWLLRGVGKGLAPSPLSLGRSREAGFVIAFRCFQTQLLSTFLPGCQRENHRFFPLPPEIPGTFFPVRMQTPSATHLPQPMQLVGPLFRLYAAQQ